jgi:hypothetical protein
MEFCGYKMAVFLFIIACDVVFNINKDKRIHALILFSIRLKSTQKKAVSQFELPWIVLNKDYCKKAVHCNSTMQSAKHCPCIPRDVLMFYCSMFRVKIQVNIFIAYDKEVLMLTRRYFLRLLAGLPLLSLPFSFPRVWAQVPAAQQAYPEVSIGETFAGEEIHYDIAFWFLRKIAVVRMTFTRDTENGRYLSTLQGETVGFAGFVTRYRRDTYSAVMEELDGGKRLRSLSFEEQVRIGQQSRKSTHTFDHKNRKWVQQNIRMSGATSKEEHDIPVDHDYNDFLTASYNFRYGVYGAAERGKAYRVPVFPKKGVTTYELKIASRSEEDSLREERSVSKASEYRIELAMDPEVLQSKKGLIKGWLAKELYPVEGIMEDVFLFGDVRGTLVKRIKG